MAIIAITQQIGSGGENIAAMTANALGYRLLRGYDLISRTSSRYNVSAEQLQVLDERKPHFWERLGSDTGSFLAFMRAVILDEMRRDKVIIVSRAAAHHLPDSNCGIRVHLIGALADRVKRVAADEKLALSAAEKRVVHHDKEIRSRVQTTSNVDIEDPLSYAITLNTSVFAPEECAALLVGAARSADQRAKADDWSRLNDLAVAAAVRAAIHAHPKLNHSRIDVQCADGAVRVTGPGLVPPWDGLADQVVRQIEGVRGVEIIAEAPGVIVTPE
jgi:cytidylate kinase